MFSDDQGKNHRQCSSLVFELIVPAAYNYRLLLREVSLRTTFYLCHSSHCPSVPQDNYQELSQKPSSSSNGMRLNRYDIDHFRRVFKLSFEWINTGKVPSSTATSSLIKIYKTSQKLISNPRILNVQFQSFGRISFSVINNFIDYLLTIVSNHFNLVTLFDLYINPHKNDRQRYIDFAIRWQIVSDGNEGETSSEKKIRS